MQDVYVTEREGQIDFYKSYLPLIDNDLDLKDVSPDNKVVKYKTRRNKNGME